MQKKILDYVKYFPKYRIIYLSINKMIKIINDHSGSRSGLSGILNNTRED